MSLSFGLYKFISRSLTGKSFSSTANQIASYCVDVVDTNNIKIVVGSRYYNNFSYDSIEFYWINPKLGLKRRYEEYKKYENILKGKIYIKSHINAFTNHSTHMFGEVYKVD